MASPSVLLAYYLHGVEERMREEAAIREEIQERTGVSSRGFLIPKREVREEVLGKLSAGNQRGVAEDDKADGREVSRMSCCRTNLCKMCRLVDIIRQAPYRRGPGVLFPARIHDYGTLQRVADGTPSGDALLGVK